MSFVAIAAGAGVAAGGVGLFNGLKGAKHMEQMKSQVPTYQRSKFVGDRLTTAQNELNANPFLAAQSRRIDTTMANQIGATGRASTDPSQILALVNAYGAQANQTAEQNDLQNYAQRGQRLNDVYGAQAANTAEDQNYYNNQMTRFNSQASLQQAADQTKANAWNSFGGTLMGAANIAGNMKLGSSPSSSSADSGAIPNYHIPNSGPISVMPSLSKFNTSAPQSFAGTPMNLAGYNQQGIVGTPRLGYAPTPQTLDYSRIFHG